MTPIDLPDAARETGVVGLGCQEADKTPIGSQTGSLSKDSGELCKLRNPRHPQALAPSFPPLDEAARRRVAGQKTYGRGEPGHLTLCTRKLVGRAYFHSTFITS
jgi:hypothetical protein